MARAAAAEDVRADRRSMSDTRDDELGTALGRGRRRLPPGGRQPPADRRGVRAGQRRLHGAICRPPRQARGGSRDHRPVLVDPGRTGQSLRRQQAPGRGGRCGRSTRRRGAPVCIFRLQNVFGKWCRPNYNSVVATFCHNIARGLPITISDPTASSSWCYVDDVVRRLLAELHGPHAARATA